MRQALSLAIDRKQVIEHVMNGKARMPYPFATFAYTEYFSADRWEKWAAEAYRYDPALAKKMLAEEGYPNGFELKFANTALPGTQFMVDIGTAIADMWTKIGVKVTLKHYEWGSFAPHGARRPGAAGRLGLDVPHGRPARRAVALQRRLLARQHPAPAGRQGQLRRDLPGVRQKIYTALLAERDKAKRTALTDRMVELVANTWMVVPIIEGMGYYAINTKKVGQFEAIPGRHELGDVFERIPRPEQKPWKK